MRARGGVLACGRSPPFLACLANGGAAVRTRGVRRASLRPVLTLTSRQCSRGPKTYLTVYVTRQLSKLLSTLLVEHLVACRFCFT